MGSRTCRAQDSMRCTQVHQVCYGAACNFSRIASRSADNEFVSFAVPLTVFLLDYCIRYPAESMTDVAARELESVSVDFGDL